VRLVRALAPEQVLGGIACTVDLKVELLGLCCTTSYDDVVRATISVFHVFLYSELCYAFSSEGSQRQAAADGRATGQRARAAKRQQPRGQHCVRSWQTARTAELCGLAVQRGADREKYRHGGAELGDNKQRKPASAHSRLGA